MLLKALKVAADRIANVGDRLVARVALRNASGKRGAFGDEHTVFIGLDQHAESHTSIVASCARGVNRAMEQLLTR